MHLARSVHARARAALAAAVVVAVSGGLPGARLRETPRDPALLPVPSDVHDRDGVLDATVVDAHGSAVAGARVRAFAMIGDRAYLAAERATEMEGGTRLSGLPRTELWVLVDAAGFGRGSSHLVLDALAGPSRAVTIALASARAIDVLVRDELGQPVQGAIVEASTDRDPLPVGERTAGDGRAHLGRLADGPWRLVARAPGFDDATGAATRDGEGVTMTLRKLGALRVHAVEADGRPAARARVAVAGATLWPARVADTNESGDVRIAGLFAGNFALRATRDAMVSPIEFGVSVEPGEEKSVELRLAPGRFVPVFVTDGDTADGDPVPGARITLAEGGLSPFPLEATTDRRGHARLGPIAPGSATLSARAEGFVSRGAVAVADPAPPETRVVLARAARLRGRVLDVRGRPIDGATVEVVGTDLTGGPVFEDPRRERFQAAHFDAMLGGPAKLQPAGELGVIPGPVPPVPLGPSPPANLPVAVAGASAAADPWVTRGDGSFEAFPVTPGRVRAVAHHPQFIEGESDFVTLAPGGLASVDIILHEGGTLEGHVVDTRDRPVAGVRVVASSTRSALEKVTRTASDGSFAFTALPESVTLSARPEDDATPEVRMALTVPEGGRQDVTVRLPEPREPLPIHVMDRGGGAPVAAAQIAVASLSADAPLRATAFTDASGDALVARGRGVPLRVEVRAPSRAPRVLVTDASSDSLRVELSPAESASGLVVSARGRTPVASADVALYTDFGARRARTNDRGAFSLTELAPGAARLHVTASGFAPLTVDLTVPDSDGTRELELDVIELVAEGVVEGTVLDASGAPVAGARVARDHVATWLVVGSISEGLAVTDGRGRFRLGGLPEGPVTLEAYAADLGRAQTLVSVAAGRTADRVKLVFSSDSGAPPAYDSAASVAVTLGETGAPVEVAIVSVAPSSEAERAGLAPGDVLLAVDGVGVSSMDDARARLNGPLADDVLLLLRRGGEEKALRVGRDAVHR